MLALPAGALTEMVGKYVSEQTGMELKPDTYQAFMVVNDANDFVAGVVISNFRGNDCEVSAASETPQAWRPNVCRAIFSYIFNQLGCVRCTCITVKGNKRARAFMEALGFQLEGNLRMAFDGKRDALIYGLLKSECRFLKDENEEDDGQEIASSTAPSAGSVRDGTSAVVGEQAGGDSASEPEQDQSVHATG